MRQNKWALGLAALGIQLTHPDCQPLISSSGVQLNHDAVCLHFAQAMMIEMARIRLHGFSQREVDQARASMMSDVESAYIERDQDYSQVGIFALSQSTVSPCNPTSCNLAVCRR